ncbi:mechanosensitive ion channel family protein [Palleronia sp. LCG004]|uniref:mechanosensitive ion channel family protein n=1 Tax=Palleronia sp. LCG004 TaxID=3079304 RepID=UPI0029437221|nr:mechanosensitive ion channel domain-containing protein [Palleronia sp. LCG004]WOI56107.1 mechanosensitive ion channel [Palleronia sp. LCG004]
MDAEIAVISEELARIWALLRLQVQNLALPSRLWQLGVVAALIVAAIAFARLVQPRMREWMRGLENRPKWQLRLLLTINRRLKLIFFTIFVWIALWTMRGITPYPSRSYILAMVASLALAWLAVVFAVRLVRNPALRSVVRWGLWIWVTLYLLGITDEVGRALDRVAFTLGEFRLSLLSFLKVIVLVSVLLTIARILSSTSAERIRRNESISPSMRVLVVKMLQIGLYGAALFAALRIVGVDLTGLAVLSGAIGVGLGFGLQKVVSNLVSGVIILLDKSIKPGDVISLGDTFGWINTLGARYASITTRDGKEYLIPNEDLITGQVVNWSHSNEFVRLDIFFGTAYHDDPHAVRRIAIGAASGVARVLSTPAPVCHITGFGGSSVDYILRFWITDPTGGLTNIRGNVYLALWDAFKEEGISIPFPQREVRVVNDTLRVETGADRDNGP